MSESLISSPDFVSRLIRNKKFRDSYSYELVRTGIPFQMRALREQRGWTQADLAEAVGKPRSVITRLESPGYGKLSLKSLFEIASGFDVGLMVKFVPFSRLLKEYDNVSPEALSAASVKTKDEIKKLDAWARRKANSDQIKAEDITNEAEFTQIPLPVEPQSEQVLTATGNSNSPQSTRPQAKSSKQFKGSNVVPFRRRRHGNRGRIRQKPAA